MTHYMHGVQHDINFNNIYTFIMTDNRQFQSELRIKQAKIYLDYIIKALGAEIGKLQQW